MSHEDGRDKPKLLEQVMQLIRIRHYSIRAEQAYLQWIRRYIIFHGKRHPADLGAEQLTQFLSDLAIRGTLRPPLRTSRRSIDPRSNVERRAATSHE